ncbi:hypothetical protein [Spirosoma endophyticum]|uniref:Uncharacterized protein n=1 Tax=Spirosoma endophyticum TaxID=662367 RepID=A0A1I2I2G1_9BACT|nr:hypothetical protein [Spirosoma endophyticum]SFF35257.1 hypothetical protein SAMN05216167_15213 [Spirosoma endophyticum]
MKMNTQPLLNLQLNLDELVKAFDSLPNEPSGNFRHSVKFTVTDDHGNLVERELLFSWNQDHSDWELNAKGHDLLITASDR